MGGRYGDGLGGLKLTGDRKVLRPNERCMPISFEVPFPDSFQLLVRIEDETSPGSGTLATFKLRSGINRAVLETEQFDASGLTRAFVGRSMELVVINGNPENPSAYVQAPRLLVVAVVIPMAVVVDPRLFGPQRGANDVPAIDLIVNALDGTPRSRNTSVGQSVATQAFGDANRGMTIYNDSSANLYISLGSAVSLTDFTCRLVPGAYYETPFGWSGPVVGVWDGAGAGNARITRVLS